MPQVKENVKNSMKTEKRSHSGPNVPQNLER